MKQRELDARSRANLFKQLAQTERAGVPILDAIAILSAAANASLGKRLSRFRRIVSAGIDVAEAGLRSGLFLPWEARLLRAAEISGKLAQSYAGLSRRHSYHAHRMSQIKGGLILPLVMFVLVVILTPLPALFRGDINGLVYLALTAGRLFLFFGGLYLLTYNWKRLGASGADNTIFRLLLRIPLFGGLIRRQQRRDFLHSLALLLEAGVPAFEALGIAADSVSHPGIRKRFADSVNHARSGATVSEALESCGALQNSDTLNLLRTGEFAGRLSEMIHHHVMQLDEQLDGQFKMIADWTPRVVYLLIVVFFILG